MMNHQKENDLGDVQRQTARGRSRYSGPKKSDATTSNFDRVQSRSPLNFRNYAVLCPLYVAASSLPPVLVTKRKSVSSHVIFVCIFLMTNHFFPGSDSDSKSWSPYSVQEICIDPRAKSVTQSRKCWLIHPTQARGVHSDLVVNWDRTSTSLCRLREIKLCKRGGFVISWGIETD